MLFLQFPSINCHLYTPQVQSKLASKDLELAKTQQNLALLQSEVVELRRFSKRDGINMDYLKNIVIQVRTRGVVKISFCW